MPLRKEDRIHAEEFLRMTADGAERQELICGEIIALAFPSQLHQEVVGGLYAAIRSYIRANQGSCKPFIAPFDVKLNDENVVIPDVMVVCDPEKLDGKRCNGAPDWVIEVTSSNYRTDVITKLILYKESGVREYWIVDPEQQSVFVCHFEQSMNAVQFYNFDQPIPVGIYQDAPVQLTICINEIL